MTQLTENICTTLKRIFPNTPAVTELANDGSFITPLLLVRVTSTQYPRKLNKEQMRATLLDVAYFVDVDGNNLEALNAAGEKIMSELDVIIDENGNPYLQVISPDWQITDKVGHLTFSVIQRMQFEDNRKVFGLDDLEAKGGIKH